MVNSLVVGIVGTSFACTFWLCFYACAPVEIKQDSRISSSVCGFSREVIPDPPESLNVINAFCVRTEEELRKNLSVFHTCFQMGHHGSPKSTFCDSGKQ
jgi:hypothetical protein